MLSGSHHLCGNFVQPRRCNRAEMLTLSWVLMGTKLCIQKFKGMFTCLNYWPCQGPTRVVLYTVVQVGKTLWLCQDCQQMEDKPKAASIMQNKTTSE